MDINHHKTLYELHQKVNSKEQIVGWCAPFYMWLSCLGDVLCYVCQIALLQAPAYAGNAGTPPDGACLAATP